MRTFTLTESEYELLTSVLSDCLEELRNEIRETDSFDYRALLRGRESGLTALAQKLRRADLIAAEQCA